MRHRGTPFAVPFSKFTVPLLVTVVTPFVVLLDVEKSVEARPSNAPRCSFTAAIQAARMRFRAILMTAFSSILGFLPLVVASGAGAASRQSVGNAVVGGMIAATFFSLAFVPSFFVIFQTISEWGSKDKT